MKRVYVLQITTITEMVSEEWFGINSAIGRLAEIEDCDNIECIDLIDTETGEVLISIQNKNIAWVSAETPVLMYEEA